MNLEEMRVDCAIKQKRRALYYSICTYLVCCIGDSFDSITYFDKKLVNILFTAPLMPLAYMISRIIKVDFTNKGNPLTNLGVLFSINQIQYLLIAMWVYPTVPEKMVMVLAMIFGAHLLPYGWLYKSKSYIAFSVIIPIITLIIGVNFPPFVVAGLMVVFEVVFSISLIIEVKNFKQLNNSRV